MLQATIAQEFFWFYSLALGKVSILLLYAKIFYLRSPFVYTTAQVTICSIVLWALGSTLSAFLICRPFAYNWNPSISDGTCGNRVLSYQIMGSLNLLTDIVVVLLPIPYLYQLRMAFYKKFVLMSVFSIGIM
jgi:hypothetical protein